MPTEPARIASPSGSRQFWRAPESAATLLVTLLLFAFASTPGSAAGPQPTFDYEMLLNGNFSDSAGWLMLDRYVAGFIPEGAKTELLILNEQQQVVSRNKFFDDSIRRDGVWAVVKPQPPLQVELTNPGIYQMVFMVNGVPATRFPFRLIQTSAGDDPFNPDKTYAFDGMWKRYAVVRMKDYDSKRKGTAPNFTVWVGQLDLATGADKGRFIAELLHNGKVVAHTPRGRGGFISNEHYRKEKFKLRTPHATKAESTNAPPYLLEDYADGSYNLRLTRLPDGQVIREFEFDVSAGKIKQLPQTAIDHEPHIDYLMPRVDDDSQQIELRMEEAVWLMDQP